LADLDHIDPEFAIFSGHLIQFGALLDAALVLPELVPIHVRDVREQGLPADRALRVCRLPMELGGPEQVRMSIADVGNRRLAGIHGRERCPAGKPVVDDGSP
jgi:hypothetical protein